MTTTERLTLDNVDITTPELYRDHGYPWAAWDLLRREAPVYRYENYRRGAGEEGFGPVWIISKHADILTVSKNPKTWIQGAEQRRRRDDMPPPRHLLAMDPPEHAQYRHLTSKHFTPRALERLAPRIEQISSEVIDDVVDRLFDRVRGQGECDFVTDLAARLPVYTICELLGVPREDAEDMFDWTNENLGAADPEYQKGRTQEETSRHGMESIIAYFSKMADDRRENPQDDLMTVLVQAEINGEPIPRWELLQYAWLLMLAGNETTRNATSGGMLALIEHPDQMARLRGDPGIAHTAVEEILRWVTPVIVFLRTATHDTEIRGQEIRQGESVALYYPSANRDEEVFDDPYRFDLTRDPNDHLAFGGYGEHFCLGANLARTELRTVFRELLQRLPEIELAGPPERLNSSFLGGIKHMPVKFKTKTVVSV